MTLIISQDPGKTTGIATYDTDVPDSFWSEQFSVDDYFAWMHQAIDTAYREGKEIHLVSESFIITAQTAKNSQAGWSLELIGVMKFLAHQYHLQSVTLQAPNVGKTFGTDAKLRTLGWFKTGGMGHANDAARHLATYAASRKLVFTTDQLKELAVL